MRVILLSVSQGINSALPTGPTAQAQLKKNLEGRWEGYWLVDNAPSKLDRTKRF